MASKRGGAKKKALEWPADRVERRSLSELVPYAQNARTHTDGQISQIAASMKEWGFTNPVLIDEKNMIIAGHGRVLAGARLGLKEVPVMVAEGWSDDQKRAYVIADNRLAETSSWDMELLGDEIRSMMESSIDLDLLGFDEGALAGFLNLEADGNFLEDMIEQQVEASTQTIDYGQQAASRNEMVNCNFPMTPPARDMVIGWLNTYRDENGLTSAAEALLDMAKKEMGL